MMIIYRFKEVQSKSATMQKEFTSMYEAVDQKLNIDYSCTFYKNGYRKCSTNPEEMNADCALSCGKCSPSVPHPGTDVCVDYLDMLGLEGYGNQTFVFRQYSMIRKPALLDA
ncbi:hypothetical protein WR25_02619 [Diploscapter pachys]|uniref:ShKT domain-containing protein n=1 Tax=Diploscapter pachys TaxID=2018661 RepID=A0A2A2LVE3_9BILA|nr:hypothetical protein WR25_02619 [Diploscapter pachys]